MRATVRRTLAQLAQRGDGWFATFEVDDGSSFQALFSPAGWEFNLHPVPARFADVRTWARTSRLTVAEETDTYLVAHLLKATVDDACDVFVGLLSWYGARDVRCIETACAAYPSPPRPARALGCVGVVLVAEAVCLSALYFLLTTSLTVIVALGTICLFVDAYLLWDFRQSDKGLRP